MGCCKLKKQGKVVKIKLCAKEGCNKEIQQWQTYCPEHYAEISAMQMQTNNQQMPVQDQQVQDQQPPQIPPLPELPKQVLNSIQTEDGKQENVDLPVIKASNTNTGKKVRLKVSAKDILSVRLESFNGAVRLLSNMDFENKKFEQLIGEIETLTNMFQDIILGE